MADGRNYVDSIHNFMYNLITMNILQSEKAQKGLDLALKICVGIAALFALLLTFTVSDYYIFNRMGYGAGQYDVFFCLSQWFKKAGLILLLLAVFFKSKSCAQVVKYFLPVFVILSCALFGGFFDASPVANSTNEEIFNSVNLFFPKWLNMTLFFAQNALYLACCGMLFLKDGYKVAKRSPISLALAVVAATPLNIFENFFDAEKFRGTFLWFKNFTVWHLLAILILIAVTVGLYNFLKNKPRETQDKYLAAIAITLLLQYHSKDSVVLGDGYNVYRTIFACLPLFICNIGVYVASISVLVKKKVLYAISFFVHAIGALTVFVYFGKDDMSNYGIFCSYSILYFCLTHCLLFALCVLPSALKHYTFKIKDCIIPLVYYFIVIIIASIASTLVSDASTKWVASDGSHLIYDGVYIQGLENGLAFMKPNFAFTQTNPLPFDVPNLIPLGGAFKHINLFYVLLVYIAYVCLFFAFYGLYRAYLPVYSKVMGAIAARRAARISSAEAPVSDGEATLEAAVTEDENAEDQADEAVAADGGQDENEAEADEEKATEKQS